MSQNKTVIQGLEPADMPSRNQGSANAGFYSRNGKAAKGTIVPGMQDRPAAQAQQTQAYDAQPQQPISRPTAHLGKPVVGFLYSVSRTGAGEYWPLQIGQNTIGQSADCHVVLPEGTVSAEHAVLVVRKMKNPEKVIASISDARSTNGTMLNGVSLGFSAEECHNGDIITIGDNYQLLLILVDAASLGLTVSQDFIPVAVEEEEAADEFDIPQGFTRPGGFGGSNMYDNDFDGYAPAKGTVGLDGSMSGGNKGGTVGM